MAIDRQRIIGRWFGMPLVQSDDDVCFILGSAISTTQRLAWRCRCQSPDSANAYLADGLTEEIISRLGRVARLQVKRSSRGAVRRVQDSEPDYLVALGRALSVRYLVEGSVRSAGGPVKVSVRLVRSTDGFLVWRGLIDSAVSVSPNPGGDLYEVRS